VWVDDSGVLLGRGSFLKYIADLDLTDYAMEGVNVTMFGNNLTVLTYNVTHHGKFAGQTIPPTPYYVGSAYLRRTGRVGERVYADDRREAVISPRCRF
jgi:hypothetical protein